MWRELPKLNSGIYAECESYNWAMNTISEHWQLLILTINSPKMGTKKNKKKTDGEHLAKRDI